MKDNYSRREFMTAVAKNIAIISIAAPMVGSNIAAMSNSTPVDWTTIRLDLTKPEYAALTRINGSIKVPDPRNKKKPIIVVRTSETTAVAFSSKCTHWGCEVSLPENGVITCHCHNSKFDAAGKVTHGPAKQDLYPFQAVLSGSTISIEEQRK
jgi:Rieske Fe-S protein